MVQRHTIYKEAVDDKICKEAVTCSTYFSKSSSIFLVEFKANPRARGIAQTLFHFWCDWEVEHALQGCVMTQSHSNLSPPKRGVHVAT